MTRVTRSHHGLVTVGRLNQLGFSKKEVLGLVAHGDLRRVHRGVYADGRSQLSDRGRLHAALLALGKGSWLPGETGVAAWGLRTGVPAVIEVALVADHTPRHPGLRIRRVVHPPHPSEIKIRNGLRVSSIPRMLIELAAGGGSTDDVLTLVDAAARKNLLNVGELVATLDRNANRRGTAKVRAACAAYLPHPGRKSKLEQSFDRWLAVHPEIPEPQRNVYLGPWEIDCYWPDRRLVLELDGREFHITAEDFERDRLKDAWLQLNGNKVLRVTWRRWRYDRPGAEHDLTAMLALASNDDDDNRRSGAVLAAG
jgi:putative AbiEi antitoxin of type IV toxin-antitoxin system